MTEDEKKLIEMVQFFFEGTGKTLNNEEVKATFIENTRKFGLRQTLFSFVEINLEVFTDTLKKTIEGKNDV